MSQLSERIFQTVKVLPENDQQQVLDFVEFLQSKRQSEKAVDAKPSSQSFFEVAQASIGVGEGPGDLSTHSQYMQGYGQ